MGDMVWEGRVWDLAMAFFFFSFFSFSFLPFFVMRRVFIAAYLMVHGILQLSTSITI